MYNSLIKTYSILLFIAGLTNLFFLSPSLACGDRIVKENEPIAAKLPVAESTKVTVSFHDFCSNMSAPVQEKLLLFVAREYPQVKLNRNPEIIGVTAYTFEMDALLPEVRAAFVEDITNFIPSNMLKKEGVVRVQVSR